MFSSGNYREPVVWRTCMNHSGKRARLRPPAPISWNVCCARWCGQGQGHEIRWYPWCDCEVVTDRSTHDTLISPLHSLPFENRYPTCGHTTRLLQFSEISLQAGSVQMCSPFSKASSWIYFQSKNIYTSRRPTHFISICRPSILFIGMSV